MIVHKRQLGVYLLLVAFVGAFVTLRGEDTRTIVKRVERQQVNACVDGHARPCRALLNRLLDSADRHQRQRIRAAQSERAQLLQSPKVVKAKPPGRVRPQSPPAGGRPPPDERPPVSTNPPTPPPTATPKPLEPNPPPTGTPTPPPTFTTPSGKELVPPAVCERRPELSVCSDAPLVRVP